MWIRPHNPKATQVQAMALKLAYQGVPGAYSEKAVHQLLGANAATTIGHASFESAVVAVQSGAADYALVPIENTLGGTIHVNYDLILRYKLHIVAETHLRVNHHLLGLPGSTKDAIKTVISHPQALAQCDRYIRNLGAVPRDEEDTAGSAKLLAAHPDWKTTAAIASDLAASLYGLVVLDSSIEDESNNYTRFLLLSPSPAATLTGTVKSTIAFASAGGAAALPRALASFSALHLTKLESRPFGPVANQVLNAGVTGDKYKYVFYADVTGTSAAVTAAVSALKALDAMDVLVLGTYPLDGALVGSITVPARPAAPAKGLNPLLNKLAPSKTNQIHGLTKQLEAQGETVYSLCVGEPDFNPHAAIITKAQQALADGFVKYTEVPGMIALRRGIARYLERSKGVKYDAASEILVSSGAKQSVFQALLVACTPGDKVLIPAPYWVSYPDMAKLAGAVPVTLPTTLANSYLIEPAVLRASLLAHPTTRVLILCNPSNPAGVLHGPELLAEIAEVLQEFPNVLVLADEIYEQLVFQDDGTPTRRHISVASLPNMRHRTLIINGFSKSHAMTGLRIGYMAAPKEFTAAASKIQSQITSCPSSIGQIAAIAALELEEASPTPLIAGTLANMDEKRKYVCGRLNSMPHVQYAYPTGAFYVFIELPHYIGTGFKTPAGVAIDTDEAFTTYLLGSFHCAIVPGSSFGIEKAVRLSYATSLEILGHSLDAFENSLKSLVR
ncbi:hypothetical protein H310_01469 [Aphanomyces invadans]|uniref:Prephenate dehydratase domain-containing protein n=1 Tax=Aphanomyces invadans TaxID=157072 RepID=A0A024UTP2_9STRA|nr:hypothetical protein H310_01469 [Aphanomyces invadans]ETW08998.1 hypothetical protein H310_01469 [Aphanomyces invadans]|eukprot:XP_008862803.1 hypothetical protein H310_01469 [Aphanomyces invadans]